MGEDNLGNEEEEKLIPTTTSHKSVKNPQAKLWGSPLLLQGVPPWDPAVWKLFVEKNNLKNIYRISLRVKIKHPYLKILRKETCAKRPCLIYQKAGYKHWTRDHYH